ncbi:hypothetical protein ANCDUO_06367 [Ancylostoma duodenale]|uniref:Uncharacterized protein n=1 Tax=Ancylostoma duodenale TaxID=51022 RepID=A0A0C2D1U2_9BILA|nr:hypothetical protein ANCDUO_06367 [Ancylostoma duodenale]
MELLNVVDVECRPVEMYRLGRPTVSHPRTSAASIHVVLRDTVIIRLDASRGYGATLRSGKPRPSLWKGHW